MKELIDLAEERANEILITRGYITLSEVYDIWRDVLERDRDRFTEALRNGNVTFIDWSQK